jgi:drug/metabolite transporter (DMT)-like permease
MDQSAFYNSLVVVVVPLLDYVILKREMRRKVMLAVFLAVVGVLFMQQKDQYSDQSEVDTMSGDLNTSTLNGAQNKNEFGKMTMFSSLSQNFSIGDIFCLLQATFFGIGYWRLEHVSQRYPKHALDVTVGQIIFLSIGSIVYCVADQRQIPSLDDLVGWMTLSPTSFIAALLWTGLVSTALALYLETVAIKVVSATELTIIMTSVSLWGCVFAYIVFREILSPQDFLGGLLILSGCFLATL